MTKKIYDIPTKICKEKFHGKITADGCIITDSHSRIDSLKSNIGYGWRGLKNSNFIKTPNLYNDINAMSSPFGIATTVADVGFNAIDEAWTCKKIVKETAQDIKRYGINDIQFGSQEKLFIKEECGSEIDFYKHVKNELAR